MILQDVLSKKPELMDVFEGFVASEFEENDMGYKGVIIWGVSYLGHIVCCTWYIIYNIYDILHML